MQVVKQESEQESESRRSKRDVLERWAKRRQRQLRTSAFDGGRGAPSLKGAPKVKNVRREGQGRPTRD